VRLRCFGIYSYRVADPRVFFTQISGTRDEYVVPDLEGQLRDTIVARMTECFATSDLSFLDMSAKQGVLGGQIIEQIKPAFTALGLELNQFAVENISLPDELQKILDQRIGMNMIGDMGRFTQFEAAQSLDIAAANTGGAAGMGMGLGAGAAVAQTLSASLRPTFVATAPAPAPAAASPADSSVVTASDTKFCIDCGKPIPRSARFCAECGKPQ